MGLQWADTGHQKVAESAGKGKKDRGAGAMRQVELQRLLLPFACGLRVAIAMCPKEIISYSNPGT